MFVVEQRSPYRDIDGRDLEPGTRHLWLGPIPAEPLAYLRLLAEPDGTARIGRVCTAATARGGGHSALLMAAALDLVGDGPCVLDAQAYLVASTGGSGSRASGAEYVEDGIAHVPMRRG